MSINPSPALMRSIESKSSADQAMFNGYLTGSIPTKPASRNPQFKFQGLGAGSSNKLRRMLTDNQRAVSHQRRRKFGGDGRLPDFIRSHYTEGHRAVLSVVGSEIAANGYCEMTIDQIAAIAGVAYRTVQYAFERAKDLGHLTVQYRPQRGRKSLPNHITIPIKAWLAWLRPKIRAADDSTGCKTVRTKKNNNKTIRNRKDESNGISEKSNLNQHCKVAAKKEAQPNTEPLLLPIPVGQKVHFNVFAEAAADKNVSQLTRSTADLWSIDDHAAAVATAERKSKWSGRKNIDQSMRKGVAPSKQTTVGKA